MKYAPPYYAPRVAVLPSAVFSDDRKYRYLLQRKINNAKNICVFICLNPSTADEKFDDPTVRRCIGYAREWGYGKLMLGNLYAYRATSPKEMLAQGDRNAPGLDNTGWLLYLLEIGNQPGNTVVLGWGNLGDRLGAASRLREEIKYRGYSSHVLKLTGQDEPAHPLYLRKDLVPQPYDLSSLPEAVYPDIGLL